MAGLSVPDVGGGPGTWYIYTDSDWEFDRQTSNGGKLIKVHVRENEFKTKVFGPEQFVERQRKEQELADLKAKAKAETDPKKKKAAERKVRAADFKFKDWGFEREEALIEEVKQWE